MPNGDAASVIAVSDWNNVLNDGKFTSYEHLLEKLNKHFNFINDKIVGLNAGSTFTGAFIFDNKLTLLHVGDTSCFYVNLENENGPSGLRLTTSDSLVSKAYAAGINEDEISGLHQHALSKSLGDVGLTPSICSNIEGVNLKNGYLILTTDGITDVWTLSDLILTLSESKDPAAICEDLCSGSLSRLKTNGKSNKDNITCIVLKLENLREVNKEFVEFAGAALNQKKYSKKNKPNKFSIRIALFTISILFLGALAVYAINVNKLSTNSFNKSSSVKSSEVGTPEINTKNNKIKILAKENIVVKSSDTSFVIDNDFIPLASIHIMPSFKLTGKNYISIDDEKSGFYIRNIKILDKNGFVLSNKFLYNLDGEQDGMLIRLYKNSIIQFPEYLNIIVKKDKDNIKEIINISTQQNNTYNIRLDAK